jgi:hypothetical protein
MQRWSAARTGWLGLVMEEQGCGDLERVKGIESLMMLPSLA